GRFRTRGGRLLLGGLLLDRFVLLALRRVGRGVSVEGLPDAGLVGHGALRGTVVIVTLRPHLSRPTKPPPPPHPPWTGRYPAGTRGAAGGQTPLGCQTVLISRKAVMRVRPGSAVQSTPMAGGRVTRLRVPAAASSRDAANAGSVTPVRSSPFTSACEASQGAVSATRPVSRFTTPPGRSDVASTSARVTAGSGSASAASTTTVLPATITGAITLTRPSSGESAGATTPTTPVGSGAERLKYGPAT